MAITDLEPRLLVEAHNAGDDEAFTHIVRAHHRGLLAHAVRRLGDLQAAEDAVQETFVRAYRAMPRFDGDFQLRAWLHRILTNVCHDEGARRRRDGRIVELMSARTTGSSDPADIDVDRMDVSRDVVAAALATLPESYRQALVLRYVDELSYDQVAAATGVSTGNARVRVMRGRAALQRALASSHAVVVAVVPWLRRGGRTGVSDLSSIGVGASTAAPSFTSSAMSLASSTPVLSNAPLLVRAADAVPQVAERAATLPQIVGIVAAMAVPLAAPVVGGQVVDWASPPPAAEAAPADTAPPSNAAAPPGSGAAPAVADRPARQNAPKSSGAKPSDPAADAAAAADAVGLTSAPAPPTTAAPVAGPSPGAAGQMSTTPPVTTTPVTTAPARDTTEAKDPAPVPKGATGPAPAPTTTTPPAVTAPAPVPPVTYRITVAGARITSVGDPRTDVAGGVTWGDGTSSSGGQLRGMLVFDRPLTTDAVAPGEAAVDLDAAEQLVPGPRRFSGELVVALDGGRTNRLRITGGTLDAPGPGAMADFELLDACDAVVATGSLSGTLRLEQAPLPSSLELSLSGTGPGDLPPCG